MQDSLDYQRGLESARADAKQGWARCWMPASQLAEQAVYSAFGLSAEQLGYAAGLDEAFPGGLGEISAFLAHIHPPEVQGAAPATWQEPGEEPRTSADALATVVLPACGSGNRTEPGSSPQVDGQQWGNAPVMRMENGKWGKESQKKAFLARFVYVCTHTDTP